jgi:hypothetical protein
MARAVKRRAENGSCPAFPRALWIAKGSIKYAQLEAFLAIIEANPHTLLCAPIRAQAEVSGAVKRDEDGNAAAN